LLFSVVIFCSYFPRLMLVEEVLINEEEESVPEKSWKVDSVFPEVIKLIITVILSRRVRIR